MVTPASLMVRPHSKLTQSVPRVRVPELTVLAVMLEPMSLVALTVTAAPSACQMLEELTAVMLPMVMAVAGLPRQQDRPWLTAYPEEAMLRVLIPRAWMRAPGSAVIVSLTDPATLVSNRWTGATKLTVPRCWGVAPVALPLSVRMLRADVAVPEAEP